MIGELARKRGAESPGRLVASAKSWLSYAAANRAAPILPWQAPEEVSKISPVEVSSHYLRYLRTIWDVHHAADGKATPWPNKTFCSPCPLRLTKKREN